MNNRVSKLTVMEALRKYMADDLAEYIFREVERLDEAEESAVIGMTFGEWRTRFDENCAVVWADDTKVGFGKKGDPVCGNIDDCVICSIVRSQGKLTLEVWCDGLTTDKEFIKCAMEWRLKNERNQEKEKAEGRE